MRIWVTSSCTPCLCLIPWRFLVMLTSLHLWLHVTTIAIVVLNCGLSAIVAVALSSLLMIALLLVHSMDRR